MKKFLLLTIAFTVLLLSSCVSKNNILGESQVNKQTENTDKQTENMTKQTENTDKQTENMTKQTENTVKQPPNTDGRTQKTNGRTEKDGSESFTKEKKLWKTLLGDENQIAESTLEAVLLALKNEDKEALKSLYSKRALSEAEDFDEHWDYLMSFFQGKIRSYDWEGTKAGPQSSETIQYGKRQKELKSWFEVVTDKQTYIFFLFDYPVDDFNSDNVGLYALRVIKAEDAETELGYWTDMKIPGIYKPDK